MTQYRQHEKIVRHRQLTWLWPLKSDVTGTVRDGADEKDNDGQRKINESNSEGFIRHQRIEGEAQLLVTELTQSPIVTSRTHTEEIIDFLLITDQTLTSGETSLALIEMTIICEAFCTLVILRTHTQIGVVQQTHPARVLSFAEMMIFEWSDFYTTHRDQLQTHSSA